MKTNLIFDIVKYPIMISLSNSNLLFRSMCLIVLFFIMCLTVLYLGNDYATKDNLKREASCYYTENHKSIIERYYAKRMSWKTSNLGSIMFKNVPSQIFNHASRKEHTYVILIWKYWHWLKNRHIKNFRDKENEPLNHCSVKNCIFTGNDSLINKVDAVVVHIQKGQFPVVKRRRIDQRWILLSDESPINIFSLSKEKTNILVFANMYNWTMTYRSDSDVPVPYGRTVPLARPLIPAEKYENVRLPDIIPNWSIKKHDVLVAVLMSNCVPYRMKFLEELKKYMAVDIYGKCSADYKTAFRCPGHFREECKPLAQYLFYLVLENSKCRQYITEKMFFNAYFEGAIPVIVGPPLEDCETLLPPKSFIHSDNFVTIEELAIYLKNVRQDDLALREYHRWRNHFEVVNEHGYFGVKSYHYCRVCEALNYNDGEVSIYDEDELRLFFDKNISCIMN